MMSFVPPGGNPTMKRTGRDGNPCGSCAEACMVAPSNSTVRMIRFSGFMCTPIDKAIYTDELVLTAVFHAHSTRTEYLRESACEGWIARTPCDNLGAASHSSSFFGF